LSLALAVVGGILAALGSGLIILALLKMDEAEDRGQGRVSRGYMRRQGWR